MKRYIGRNRRGRRHKLYFCWISINTWIDIAMSVCPSAVYPSICLSVRMKPQISEATKATATIFGIKMYYYCTQINFFFFNSDTSHSGTVKRLEPNSDRNLNAGQCIFVKHNNYQVLNDFWKFHWNLIVKRRRYTYIIEKFRNITAKYSSASCAKLQFILNHQ